MTPEFSRRVALENVDGPVQQLTAEPGEREALARRFGWLSLDALSASVTLAKHSGGIDANGVIAARLTQGCVVTGDPVPASIETPFAVRFVAVLAEGDEVELTATDLDTVEHDGMAVDIGEAVAQTLALAAEPFPRSPGADAQLQAAVMPDEAGPFAALKRLLQS